MEHLDAAVLARLDVALAGADDAASRAARARRLEGTYGLCGRCGDAIAADVLLERATWSLCRACGDALDAAQRGRRLGVCGVKPGPA